MEGGPTKGVVRVLVVSLGGILSVGLLVLHVVGVMMLRVVRGLVVVVAISAGVTIEVTIVRGVVGRGRGRLAGARRVGRRLSGVVASRGDWRVGRGGLGLHRERRVSIRGHSVWWEHWQLSAGAHVGSSGCAGVLRARAASSGLVRVVRASASGARVRRHHERGVGHHHHGRVRVHVGVGVISVELRIEGHGAEVRGHTVAGVLLMSASLSLRLRLSGTDVLLGHGGGNGGRDCGRRSGLLLGRALDDRSGLRSGCCGDDGCGRGSGRHLDVAGGETAASAGRRDGREGGGHDDLLGGLLCGDRRNDDGLLGSDGGSGGDCRFGSGGSGGIGGFCALGGLLFATIASSASACLLLSGWEGCGGG